MASITALLNEFFPVKKSTFWHYQRKRKTQTEKFGKSECDVFSSESERSVTFILAFLTSAAVHTVQATTTKAAAGVIATSTTIT